MKKTQQGISLMEVLVSLFLLSIGLSGILKMQLSALQGVNSAYNTSIAIIRAESLQVILKQKPDNFSEWFNTWQAENQQMLPEPKAELSQNKLRLRWFDRFMQKVQVIMLPIQE